MSTTEPRPRALVVFERTGAGHEACASLIERELTSAGWAVTRATGGELVEDRSVDLVIAAWNHLVRRGWFRAADACVNFLTRYLFLPVADVTCVARAHAKLDQLAPQLIVSTCDGFNKGLGAYAGERGVPFVIFVTDLTVFFDVIHPNALHLCYFRETAAALGAVDLDHEYFRTRIGRDATAHERARYVAAYLRDCVVQAKKNPIHRGLASDNRPRNALRTFALGPWRAAAHHVRRDRTALRDKLRIPPSARAIVVASGSIGGRFVDDVVTELANRMQGPLVLLAVTGKDEETRKTLAEREFPNPGISVRALGNVDRFDEVLGAADLLVARPSAGVFMEALLARVPVLLPSRTTVNDRGALALTKAHGLGECFTGERDLPGAAERLLANGAEYRANIERFLASYPLCDAAGAEFRRLIANELRQPSAAFTASASPCSSGARPARPGSPSPAGRWDRAPAPS